MSPRNTRIAKEARELFWPWCMVTIIGTVLWLAVASGFRVPYGELSVIAFSFGIPLLATLSFGSEFQHRTLSLLLTQPVSRSRVWSEKLGVLVVATSLTALVYYVAWRDTLNYSRVPLFIPAILLVTSVASSTFWTLSARSTIGGMTLNLLAQSIVIIGIQRILELTGARIDAFPAVFFVSIAVLAYAVVMLCLGRRKLIGFQTIGEIAGTDVLTSGSNIMPRRFSELVRWRTKGASLNLARKELRLLRPVGLIALLCLVMMLCLAPLRFLPGMTNGRTIGLVAFIPLSILTLLMVVLAGTLPVAEERFLGTHAWHATLPVPARRQWLIKLAISILVSVASTFLVSNAGRFIFGAPFRIWMDDIYPSQDVLFSIAVPLLTFTAFWCGCAVTGAMRAILWITPVLTLVAGALGLGVIAANSAITGRVVDIFISRLLPFPFSVRAEMIATALPVWWIAPVLLFAVIQSYRLFRTDQPDGTQSMLRRLAARGGSEVS